ncbi:hypothetical protein HELRODRAFT_83265, partial [Helobdella robusta]|uniref:HAT C-terminal dimerisation domain-containing protein n=1 Tax=Helobdella robusta TaxID=6412 RepID=T1G530_HELRO
LTISMSTATCQLSFSKLKLILCYLRATISQQRLCNLALTSIEENEMNGLNFIEIINELASAKARKVKKMK